MSFSLYPLLTSNAIEAIEKNASDEIKKLYLPKANYYFGTTLKFIASHTKRKFIKENISLKDLDSFDEILLVGSGKGVVKLKRISQINWNNKSNIIFNELHDLYNSYITQ